MGSPGELTFIHPEWSAPKGIHAICTTRFGGRSQGPWQEFNLAAHVGDDVVHLEANRQLLVKTLNLPAEPLWLKQVHGCEVTSEPGYATGAECDASVAFEPGVVCAVLTADCLPLLLCSKNGDRVAAVHAGWRGLAAGIIEKTVEALGGAEPGLMVWLGPAIGPQAFEVGEDVYHAFVSQDQETKSAFSRHGDRWLCDIYQLARKKLTRMHINNISGGGLCTLSDAERFYSYRRDGVTGRMASLIWIDK